MRLRAFAAAKINLSLNVFGRNSDGYHPLDSIMQSIDLGDFLTVSTRADSRINLRFVGADIDQKNNTVMRAVELVQAALNKDFGLDILVEKNVPIGGGLGGSSADAAAIIRILDEIFSLNNRGISLIDLAKNVGSDVPFMLFGGVARVTGTGEKIQKINSKLDFSLVLGRKAGQISLTKEVFARFDKLGDSGILADNDLIARYLKEGDCRVYSLFSNGLTEAASLENPFNSGGIMTGSGSFFFKPDGEIEQKQGCEFIAAKTLKNCGIKLYNI